MHFVAFILLVGFLGTSTLGCGSKDAAEKAPETASEKSGDKKKKKDKDRGEATMTLGGSAWQADRASAKLESTRLTIRATRTDINDKKVSRQELQLQLTAFKGPGEYTTGSGSRFIGVGLDGAKAEESEAAATNAAMEAVTRAKHLMLLNATVTITAASDTEVSGTFSWASPPGLDQPAITNGSFRAPLEP